MTEANRPGAAVLPRLAARAGPFNPVGGTAGCAPAGRPRLLRPTALSSVVIAVSAPVSQQSLFGGIRSAAVSVVSGSAVVTALTMANASWEAVVLTVGATFLISLVLGLAKIVVPDESEHKRDLVLEYFRYRERRAELRKRRRRQRESVNPQEQRDRSTGGDRTLP
ncbi:hypothetical protein OHB41_48760 [Streptomyces sp. NBC_01571]|uniref:hypothetical protein n=1 Tax=Streptomyces sp. NBC_01571 TaxID=2975883 RepID=UPI00225B5551|nr:hypothetical protein [Streptomyces sp. NBC_01571]MCX4580865.1 hypothetical protein [Streptomyces sp. NBC_01571]